MRAVSWRTKSQLLGGTPAVPRSLRIVRQLRRPARRGEAGTGSPHAAQPGRSNAYCREIRCALFHEAMTRTGTVVVKGADHTLQVAEHPVTKKLRIEIDPFQLLQRIQTHFDGYVAKLRNSSETAVRENFEREWDRRTSA